jgi:hypothetical protein
MNFIVWLLKRMKRTIFGDEWGWLYKYREFIQAEMPLAILLTLLVGLLWIIATGVVFAYFIEDRDMLHTVMKCVIACPPLFFVYNWFYTLYEIYHAERMEMWEELKR